MGRPGRSTGRRFLATGLGIVALALPCSGSAQAAFPIGGNGDIAYQRFTASGFEVFSMRSTGADQLNLTNTPGFEANPSYSPDGRRMLFIRGVGGQSDVFVMNADGSGQVNLTNTPTRDELSPMFSPNGRSIAFHTEVDEDPPIELGIMASDGSGRRLLTDTPTVHERHPDFSPDGRRITFERCEGQKCEIYTIAPDGSGLANLANTPAPASERDPAFSPDGRRIAFTTGPGAGDAIAVMNADGSGATTIFASALGPGSPGFSPDGRLIAYTADAAQNLTSEIFTINADGSGPANLTNTPTFREEVHAWQAIFTCGGRQATIVGSDAGEKLKGTKRADVIVANGGKDKIKGKGGKDRLCGGTGKDKLKAGPGNDRLFGGSGKDKLSGAKGTDRCAGGKGRDAGKGCEKGKL
jgi:Tol biopolymer transport system component